MAAWIALGFTEPTSSRRSLVLPAKRHMAHGHETFALLLAWTLARSDSGPLSG